MTSGGETDKRGREDARHVARKNAVGDADRRAALLVGGAQELLATSQRLAGLLRRLARNEEPTGSIVDDLRAVLNDIAATRRTLDSAWNDVQEATDRLLDVFDVKTRHLLGEK